MPTAWSMRVVTSSDPQNGGPADSTGKPSRWPSPGLADNGYNVPNMRVEALMKDTHMPVWFWRAPGAISTSSPSKASSTRWRSAAGLDPYQMRRKLLEGKPDWLKVLDTAAEKGDWGKPLPKGRGRGIAICEDTDSLCAQVAEVTVKPNGEVKVDRVTVALDTRYMVNPLTIAEQAEGSVIFGLSAALFGKITIKDGVPVRAISTPTAWCASPRRRRSTSICCRAAARSGAVRASPRPRRSPPLWPTRSSPQQASASARCRSSTTICPTGRPEPFQIGLHEPSAPGESTASPGAFGRRQRRVRQLRHQRLQGGLMKRTSCSWRSAFRVWRRLGRERAAKHAERQRRISRPRRRLHRLPFRPRRQGLCGRPAHGNADGRVYSTNITPDPETGIGNYSLEDFDRAVRSGGAKDGHHLYPAMPYPSYAKISDDDLQALYTFFMKEVPPVKQANKPNEIPWYLSARWPLAIWNIDVRAEGGAMSRLRGRTPPGTAAPILSRGSVIAARATRRAAGRSRKRRSMTAAATYLQGAELDAWSAPNLRGDLRTGLGGWSQDDIAAFLKNGHNDKGTAFGSMLDVVNNSTPYLADDDIRAMALFLKSLAATAQQTGFAYDDATAKALQSGKPQQAGAATYLGSCAACHGTDGKGQAPFMPPLAGNPAVLDANASSLINLVLNGAEPMVVRGIPDAYRMPQFRIQLSDEQIAQVLSFVRSAWGNDAAMVTTDQVEALRPVTDPSSDRVIVLKMR